MHSIGLLGRLAQAAHACAVCFGQTSDGNVSRAYFWGILLMLGFTAALLAAIGYSIYRIELAHRNAHPTSS